MVVADERALACIFTANDVTRDGVRHDSRIRESKIFRDHAAPAIGPKFDSGHRRSRESIREAISPAKQPDWPAYQATLISSHFISFHEDCGQALGGYYKSFFSFCSSSHFTIFPTSCARSRGQTNSASGVSTRTRSRTPIAAINLVGLHRKLPSPATAGPSPARTFSRVCFARSS